MKRFYLGLALLFGYVITASADKPEEEFTEIFKKIMTLKANFLQEQSNQQGQQIFSAHGVMHIKKPNQFRWEIIEPNKQLILADGKTLWIYDVDLKQVTTHVQNKNLGSTPAAILSGQHRAITQNYRVINLQTVSANDIPDLCKSEEENFSMIPLQKFCLIPKDKDNNLKVVMINFSNDKPQTMVLMDQLNQKTTIKFSNVLIDKSIPATVFKFQAPKGIEVIKSQ